MPTLIVIGVGPGIGTSVARRFAEEGFDVGAIARSSRSVGAALASLNGLNVRTHGVTADAGDDVALGAALDDLVSRLGVPEVVVYNAAIIQSDSLGELSVAEHQQAWAVNVVGAITTAARAAAGDGRVGERDVHHDGWHADAGRPRREPVARQGRRARFDGDAGREVRSRRAARRDRDGRWSSCAGDRVRSRPHRRLVLAVAPTSTWLMAT